ncbi:MAG: hypothetical protein ACLTG4_04000 [Oscillospiraceae bacterium]
MRQRIESLEQFRALQADYMAARDAEKRKILVCCGTGCVAGGNLNVYHELKKRMDELGIPCEVSLTEHHADAIGLKKSGCHGFCEMGRCSASSRRAGCTRSARSATWRRSSRRPSSAASSSSAWAITRTASCMSARKTSRFTKADPPRA